MILHNKYDKETLTKKLMAEDFKRKTVSFYRYVLIDDVNQFRDNLYLRFQELDILGRVYVAHEGINAQISVPEFNWDKFLALLDSSPELKNVDLKIAIEDDGKSFIKLIVRIRTKIVADGLNDGAFDVTNVGRHLSAKEFNEAMQQPGTVVVDLRNHYESEVGHFKGAILPQADTFRQELPMVLDMLQDKKDNKILLYCTGGVRCEKASAFFKHHGFNDVNQLNGGIIHYARQVKAEGLQTEFIGKNFVFDQRLGERITNDIISNCHQCGSPSDRHVNCKNEECHLLFIQCESCAEKMNGCCTPECMEIAAMPIEARRVHRKGKGKEIHRNVYKSRLRPNLREILERPLTHQQQQ